MSEWFGLVFMAVALGMDAFSVTLGMGMVGLRLLHVFQIGLVIGLFHLIMPLGGMIVGKYLSGHIHLVATLIAGAVLLLLGMHMMFSSFLQKEQIVRPFGVGLILLAITVSIDSFPAGISLGILKAETYVTVLTIAAASLVLSWIGLFVGRAVSSYIGAYAQFFGGVVLIGFGISFFFAV